MSGELKDTLKQRLDENYNAFIESLQEKNSFRADRHGP